MNKPPINKQMNIYYKLLGRKVNILFLLMTCLPLIIEAQFCNDENILLTTQTEVDNFMINYGSCTIITGRLKIDDNADGNNDITNLDGLSQLTEVQGNLDIGANFILENLDGLSNLTTLGGNLILGGNFLIDNLDGLSNLTSVGGGIRIVSNFELQNLNGLSNFSGVITELQVWDNNILQNLDGLSNITGVINEFVIAENPLLENLNGLSNISSVGNFLVISNNDIITNLDPLSNITSIPNYFTLTRMNALTNIDGLANLTNVGGDFTIDLNPVLPDLNALSNLNMVGEDLIITNNNQLAVCCGLENLLNNGTVGGAINMNNNAGNCNNDGADITPENCTPPSCTISEITISNISTCNDQNTSDPNDDTFTADVTITYTNPPSSGSINLSGDGSASAVTNDPTTYTFTGVVFPADGAPINLTATFSDAPDCTLSLNAGIAPDPCSTTPNEQIDLSLDVATNSTSLPLYSLVAFTYTVNNNSPITATNIVVDIPIYKAEGFRQTTGTPSNLPPGHSFNYISEELYQWVIPNLSAFSSSSITWNLFSIQNENTVNYYTQIVAHSESDDDSTPNNNPDGPPAEDDEALVVLTGQNTPMDCTINSISLSNPSECNDQGTPSTEDDTFTADVTVTYSNPPTSGTLNLLGDGSGSIVVNSIGATSYTFFGVTMPADGGSVALTAAFSDDASCSLTNSNVGTAPEACSTTLEACVINSINVSNISTCTDQGTPDTTDDTFTADVTVIYSNAVGPGSLILSGDGIASESIQNIGATSHTFPNVTLSSDGTPIELTASFTTEENCTLTNLNAGLAPSACSSPSGGVDLELSIDIADTAPPIYTTTNVDVSVQNTGDETATGIIVNFPLPSGYVYASESSSTQGWYNSANGDWMVGTLDPGQIATFNFVLFALTENVNTSVYAQVSAQDQLDADSTPGNGTCCTINEDDEAIGFFFPNIAPLATVNSTNLAFAESSIFIANLYPNPVQEELSVLLFSKLEERFSIQVLDVLGRVILYQEMSAYEGTQEIQLDVSNINRGAYFLKIQNSTGQQSKRFIKQ